MAVNTQLIHLAQIQGGLTLKAAIESLQASYPADHVTTRIAKSDGTGDSYEVEELLLLLKTIVDTQLGNSEGSVAERLDALKIELQGYIDAINNRQVKDRVKVTGTIHADGHMDLADYSGVTALDAAIDYIVYYENNKPVRDASGNNVTYNFGTGILSDGPHVRNVSVVPKDVVKEKHVVGDDLRTYSVANINMKPGSVKVFHKVDSDFVEIVASEFYVNCVSGKILFKADQIEDIYVDYQYEISELSFVPLVGAASIKLFPIGTFKFSQLPEEYLLDNTELNLIAYSEVIDELVLGLSSDRELVNHVISMIGTEAIQNAIIKMTEDLTARVVALEARAEGIDSAYKDADAALKTDLEGQIAAEKTAREAADTALNKKFTEKDIDRQNDIMDVNSRIDELKSTTLGRDVFLVQELQTQFELSAVPTAKLVEAHVNGIHYEEIKHFTVDRVAAIPTLTWTFAASNGGFDMVGGFDVVVNYEAKAKVVPVIHIEYPA
jgi:hypothetical protein